MLPMSLFRLSLNYFSLHSVLPIWVMSFITLYYCIIYTFISPNKSNSCWIVSIHHVLGSVHISISQQSFKLVIYRWEKWGLKKFSNMPTVTQLSLLGQEFNSFTSLPCLALPCPSLPLFFDLKLVFLILKLLNF